MGSQHKPQKCWNEIFFAKTKEDSKELIAIQKGTKNWWSERNLRKEPVFRGPSVSIPSHSAILLFSIFQVNYLCLLFLHGTAKKRCKQMHIKKVVLSVLWCSLSLPNYFHNWFIGFITKTKQTNKRGAYQRHKTLTDKTHWVQTNPMDTPPLQCGFKWKRRRFH